MTEQDRHASLLIDEMKIKPGYAYDSGLGEVIGNPTIPSSNGQFDKYAEHGLVFMIRGNCSHWKQTIAFEFTGNSVEPHYLHEKIINIIQLCASISIFIDNVTSDMGPVNKSVWKLWNISGSRHSKIQNHIQHPCDPQRRLFIMPDPCHVVKNIKNSLTNKHTFTFGPEIINKYKLPSSNVTVDVLEQLLAFDEQYDLKVAPYLTSSVLKPTHFEKMNVSLAFKLFNNDVAAAIDYLISKKVFPESFRTTSWFIKLVAKWFYLMTGRHFKSALSCANENIYFATIDFFKEFKTIITHMYVDGKAWKPFQSGLLIATETALNMQQLYLHVYKVKFFMLGRLTQDALENLFSCCRARNPQPTAKEFKCNLRLITLGQYTKSLNTSNYCQSDAYFLLTFSKTHIFDDIDGGTNDEEKENNVTIDLGTNVNIPDNELNSLFYVLGNVLYKVRGKNVHCDNCFENLITTSDNPDIQNYNTLLRLKSFKTDSLVSPSLLIFQIFVKIEIIFRTNVSAINNINSTYIQAVENQILEANFDANICNCSGIFKKIVNCYLRTRMYFVLKKISPKIVPQNVYSSFSISKKNSKS